MSTEKYAKFISEQQRALSVSGTNPIHLADSASIKKEEVENLGESNYKKAVRAAFNGDEDAFHKHMGVTDDMQRSHPTYQNSKKKYSQLKSMSDNTTIGDAVKLLQKEEVETLDETHRVGVTYSDPNSSSVTMRKEKKFKQVNVKAESEDAAIAKAKKHFKNSGYRVHDATITTMKEEVEQIDELQKMNIDSAVAARKMAKQAEKEKDPSKAALLKKKSEFYKSKVRSEEVENVEEGLRKVGQYKPKEGAHHATIHMDPEYGEYKVKFYKDGKHLSKADYHTDDKDDAMKTASRQTNKMNEEVEQLDELDLSTYKSYYDKSKKSEKETGENLKKKFTKAMFKKYTNRKRGQETAIVRAGKKVMGEDASYISIEESAYIEEMVGKGKLTDILLHHKDNMRHHEKMVDHHNMMADKSEKVGDTAGFDHHTGEAMGHEMQMQHHKARYDHAVGLRSRANAQREMKAARSAMDAASEKIAAAKGQKGIY